MNTRELWFSFFFLVVMAIVLVLLFGGCTLPAESQNYNPTSGYRWIPETWDHPGRIQLSL